MLTKFWTILAYLVAGTAVVGSYSQASALHLRQVNQPLYMPRHNMVHFGRYQNDYFQPFSNRSTYSDFRGGGNFSGK